MVLLNIILCIIFIYLAFNVGYLLLFAIAGRFRKALNFPTSGKKRIAVLIPAYKEDSVIVETARKAASHDYPKDLFDVFIISDQLRTDTLELLSGLPVNIITVSFETSTKARSLKFALQKLPDAYYDMVMLLDADNIMENGCLQKASDAYSQGRKMIQLHRTAKNKNTPVAVLDALSEEINNHLFRQGQRALGASAALIGSGMAFDFSLFKSLMLRVAIEHNPAEDREINLEMLKQGYWCEYLDHALVYDEKVSSGAVLEKQRTRWISAQMQYIKRIWKKDLKRLFSYNIHYFNYALQTLLLPRSLLLMVFTLIMLIMIPLYGFGRIEIFPGFLPWMALVTGCLLSLFLSIYPYLRSKEVINAFTCFPNTFWSFFKALLKSKANQQEFVRTPKEYIQD